MIFHRTFPRIASAILLISLPSSLGLAQLSGFVSGTYGYQSNPLYNFEQTSDQVRSTYLEVEYSAEQFRALYAGGLTLFHDLTERNFLDHRLLLSLSFSPNPQSTSAGTDSIEDEHPEGIHEDSVPVTPDSLGRFGAITARFASRHDKSVFREYDNAAATLSGSLRWGIESGWHIRLVPEAEYRVYPYTEELSNASGLLTTEVGFGESQGLSGGLRALTGVKHFTVAAFDSAQFESVPTYVTVTKPGSGKGGAKITVKESSGKKILSNADIRTTSQFAGSGFVTYAWRAGSLVAEMLYRKNLSGAARILARTPESATINEDIYNDFFSYNGPEASLTFRQTLPGSAQGLVSLSYLRKKYGAPAFDGQGAEIAGARVDRRRGIEFYLSRYVVLSPRFGLDVALSGSIVRNESNDTYNDYSARSIGFSLGFGF
jgi:hypothetical protein